MEYTRDDLELMYACGTRAGLAGFYVALLASGEKDGVRLRRIKEKAKAAIDKGFDECFGSVLQQVHENHGAPVTVNKIIDEYERATNCKNNTEGDFLHSCAACAGK